MPPHLPTSLRRLPQLPLSHLRSNPTRSTLCLRCSLASARPLSTSPRPRKKGGGKQDQKRTVELNSAKTASNDDARDFSAFKTEIEKATGFLREELAKLKAGGLDLEAIEALRVTLGSGKGDTGSGGKEKGRGGESGSGSGRAKGQVVRLGDVSQVVPRGRVVVVMVGEKDVSSPFSFPSCMVFGLIGTIALGYLSEVEGIWL